jgi:hypothetical protein
MTHFDPTSRRKKFITYLLLVTLYSISLLAYSQKVKEKETILINPDARIEKFYTIDELNKMGKAELIKIYKERFKVVILLLPYSALSTNPGTTLESLGIPANSENKEVLDKESKVSVDFYEAVDESLNNFIAYADKVHIIWAIILYEDIIRKISLGKDY